MRTIQPARTYRALVRERRLLEPRDGKSRFKLYLLDVVGRPERERYEWEACGLDREAFLSALGGGLEGVGFVIAFPHIAKVFRFSPESETVLDVRALVPRDLSPIDLQRAEGFVEFACLAEALIAADEYRLWAAADDVAGYLEGWSAFGEAGIERHRKLLAWWEDGPG